MNGDISSDYRGGSSEIASYPWIDRYFRSSILKNGVLENFMLVQLELLGDLKWTRIKFLCRTVFELWASKVSVNSQVRRKFERNTLLKKQLTRMQEDLNFKIELKIWNKIYTVIISIFFRQGRSPVRSGNRSPQDRWTKTADKSVDRKPNRTGDRPWRQKIEIVTVNDF